MFDSLFHGDLEMDLDPAREAVPANNSLSASSSTKRTPRLRSSCDNCSNAKVRCDQERPSCQRCVNADIQCSYSISRRMGKRPVPPRDGNNPKSGTTSSIPSESETARTRSSTGQSHNNNSENVVGKQEHAITAQHLAYLVDQPFPATDLPSSDADFLTSICGDDPSRFVPDGSFYPNSHDPFGMQDQFWPDLSSHTPTSAISGSFSHQIPTDPFWTTLRNHGQALTGNQLSHPQMQNPFQNPPLTPHSSLVSLQSLPHVSAPRSSMSTSSDDYYGSEDRTLDKGASCSQLAASALHSLTLSGATYGCYSANSPNSTPYEAPGIGRLLEASRRATHVFHSLLACNCLNRNRDEAAEYTDDAKLTMVLLLLRILGSYRLAGRIAEANYSNATSISLYPDNNNNINTNVNSMNPETTLMTSDGTHTFVAAQPQPQPQATQVQVPPQQQQPRTLPDGRPRTGGGGAAFTIGMYRAEPEDETRLVLQLVLGELSKVERLIAKFRARFGGGGGGGGGGVIGDGNGSGNGKGTGSANFKPSSVNADMIAGGGGVVDDEQAQVFYLTLSALVDKQAVAVRAEIHAALERCEEAARRQLHD